MLFKENDIVAIKDIDSYKFWTNRNGLKVKIVAIAGSMGNMYCLRSMATGSIIWANERQVEPIKKILVPLKLKDIL